MAEKSPVNTSENNVAVPNVSAEEELEKEQQAAIRRIIIADFSALKFWRMQHCVACTYLGKLQRFQRQCLRLNERTCGHRMYACCEHSETFAEGLCFYNKNAQNEYIQNLHSRCLSVSLTRELGARWVGDLLDFDFFLCMTLVRKHTVRPIRSTSNLRS